MYNNPYWAAWGNPYLAGVQSFSPQPIVTPSQPVVNQPPPQPPQQPVQTPVQQPIQQNSTYPATWNWKVTDSYQHMLMESVPFDGTPVLFMLKNESIFYVVSMVDGKKMVNGYSFSPLDTNSTAPEAQLTPEEQNEQRFAKLETGMTAIIEQLNKLVEGKTNESNSNSSEKTSEIIRQPIN